MLSKKNIYNLSSILTGTLILCYWALYNNYPFVFSDSGSYIASGFSNWISPNRTIFYGFFIKYVSLSTTPWLVVAAQSWMVAYLIFILFKYFTKANKQYFLYISTILILTFFTGVSLNTGLIIPDIFTSIGILSFVLILVEKGLRKHELLIVGIIGFYSLLVHNSNFYIIFLALIFATIVYLLASRNIGNLLKISGKRLAVVWFLLILTRVTIPTTHYLVDGEYRNIKTTHVFIMASLVDKEILQVFLSENCEKNEYKICQYKEKIPPIAPFLWSNSSPLNLTGGAEANKEEYNKIIKKIMTTPRYLWMFILESIKFTSKQILTFDAETYSAQLADTSPYNSIKKYYPKELDNYLKAKQNESIPISLRVLNISQQWLLLLSLGVIILCFMSRSLRLRLSKESKFLISFILIGVLSNAFICATFSMITNRYQCRVVWLIPLIVIIALVEFLGNGRSSSIFKKTKTSS